MTTHRSTADQPPAPHRTAQDERPPDDSMIPRAKKSNRLVLLGVLAALAFGLYMIWGFVAPAVDPDEEPVLAPQQQLPAQE